MVGSELKLHGAAIMPKINLFAKGLLSMKLESIKKHETA